jgi:hypothetical protein
MRYNGRSDGVVVVTEMQNASVGSEAKGTDSKFAWTEVRNLDLKA